MAISHSLNKIPDDMFFVDDVKVYDYPIQGKMVVAQHHINSLEILTNEHKDHIRTHLIHQIAEAILHHKLVEFTQIKDPITFDTIVKARCFITPNTDVKILRSLHKVE